MRGGTLVGATPSLTLLLTNRHAVSSWDSGFIQEKRPLDFTHPYCFYIENNRSGVTLLFGPPMKQRVSSRVDAPPEWDVCSVTERSDSQQPVACSPWTFQPLSGDGTTTQIARGCTGSLRGHLGTYTTTPGRFQHAHSVLHAV